MKSVVNDIYVLCQGVDNEFVVVSPSDLPENPYDLVHLLKLETAPRSCWRDVANAYFHAGQCDAAVTVLQEATSDDVENLRSTMDDHNNQHGSSSPDGTSSCTRLDLLAALGGAHIMMAEATVHDPEARRESLRKAADVFSRADNIDLDDPSIWTARGWAEFHAGKASAVNWFDNARDKNVILGSVGLAALHLNRSKPASDPSRKDPVSLLVHALRSDVCPPGVWTGLAYALYKEGRMNASRNVARRALSALRQSPAEERLEALYLLATIELVDKTETSVEDMSLILREAYTKCGGDQDARILTLIANMMFNGGDFEKAEQFALRAVEAADCLPSLSVGSLFAGIRNSAKVDALFQLGRAQHHVLKFDDAMRAFVQIKKISDSGDGQQVKLNPGVLLRLGLLKLSTGRKDDESLAKECLEKVLKASNDRCGIAKRALGVLVGREVLLNLRKGRPRGGETYERAVKLLCKGLDELDSEECDVPAYLVYAALVEEYYPQKALESYEPVLNHLKKIEQPIDNDIWNNYAAVLARCGNVTKALEIYENKIDKEFSDECMSVMYNRGRLAEMTGKFKEAENIYRSLPKEHAHYYESVVRLGVMRIENQDGGYGNRMEEAEKLFKEAKESSGTRPVAIAHLSSLYALQKKYKQAQKELESHRHDCDYLSLLFLSFMHRFLDGLESDRRTRFLINHIGTPLIQVLKRNSHNACAANGLGVYFAESKMLSEARDAFITAGSGPLADRVARVNLAHVQMHLGIREFKESAKATGRPSLRIRMASRSLYEQAGKLYSDALGMSKMRSTNDELSSYCELLLYSAWAQFEGGEFGKSSHSLCKLLHVMPSCSVAWFNLSKALLEKALKRVAGGTDRLDEMQAAKTEFEGSRMALTRFSTWKRPYVDALANVRVSSAMVVDMQMYVRQEAKSHDVKLRNAIDQEDDRKERLAAKTRELQAHEDRRKEKVREKEVEKTRKEQELRRAFEESIRKQKENEEAYQRMLAEKRAADEVSGDEDAPAAEKKNRTKRKRKEAKVENGESNGGSSKKAKRSKKISKKLEEDISADEYSETGSLGDAEDPDENEKTSKKRDDPPENDERPESGD